MNKKKLKLRIKDLLKILCIGDVHAPYTDISCMKKIHSFAQQYKPNVIVQMGDLYDNYNYSRYSKSLNHKKPKDETNEARRIGEFFWNGFDNIKAVKLQLLGNHCVRFKKRVLERLPEFELPIDNWIKTLYTYKGVKTVDDDRSEIYINGILFIHGYLSNLGDHLKMNRRSVVVGHSHKGGCLFMRHNDKTLFELNCGHIADDKKLPFCYTPQRTNFWTKGFGVIEEIKSIGITSRFISL